MAKSWKSDGFKQYVEVRLSGDDIADIKMSHGDIDAALLEIYEYANKWDVDFFVKYNNEDGKYIAGIYVNERAHDWHGLGVRAKAVERIEAVLALSIKIRKLGDRTLLELYDGNSGDGDII